MAAIFVYGNCGQIIVVKSFGVEPKGQKHKMQDVVVGTCKNTISCALRPFGTFSKVAK